MHDPLVVAFEVHRPWPRRDRMHDTDPDSRSLSRRRRWSWRLRHEHWDGPAGGCGDACRASTRDPFPWWKPSSYSPFMTLAGRGFYWPSIVTIWHREPGGHDSGEVCKQWRRGSDGKARSSRSWRWHVWHWRIQVSPLQELHRRIFARCGWCGGRSTKLRPVNVSHQWDRETPGWFRIDRGAFHMDCSSIESAHRRCTCTDPMPGRSGVPGESMFRCEMCGLHCGSGPVTGSRRQGLVLLKTIPRGEFHPGTYREARLLLEEAYAAEEHARVKAALKTTYMGT